MAFLLRFVFVAIKVMDVKQNINTFYALDLQSGSDQCGQSFFMILSSWRISDMSDILK